MTEIITNGNTNSASKAETKALLVRLAIESRYRSPNGGYVSTFSKGTSESTANVVASNNSAGSLTR